MITVSRTAMGKLAEARELLKQAAEFAKSVALVGPAAALRELAARKIRQAIRQMNRRPKKR